LNGLICDQMANLLGRLTASVTMISDFLKANAKSYCDTSYLTKYRKQAELFIKDFPSANKVLSVLEGCTFDKGLFRIHSYGSSFFWTKISRDFLVSIVPNFAASDLIGLEGSMGSTSQIQ
jgi:hypothetical protein